MTWHWFPFLVGAPIWASIGIALFAALLASNNERRAGHLLRSHLEGAEEEGARVISLDEFRRRRARPPLGSASSNAQTRV